MSITPSTRIRLDGKPSAAEVFCIGASVDSVQARAALGCCLFTTGDDGEHYCTDSCPSL